MALKNRRVFELRLAKLGLALFVGGMSLLLFLFFLLGVFVGKNMEAYPERYASGLPGIIGERWFSAVPQPERSELTAPDQGAKEEPDSADADIGLTFYDTLGGAKGGSPAGRSKEKPGEVSVPQEVAKGKPGGNVSSQTLSDAPAGTQGTRNAGEEGAKRTAAPERAVVAETHAPKPRDEGTAQRTKERFEVQVGAYRDKKQADLTMAKFGSLGFSPQVVLKEFPDTGRWFRVVVAGFDNRESAQKAADQMMGKVRGLKCVIRASDKE